MLGNARGVKINVFGSAPRFFYPLWGGKIWSRGGGITPHLPTRLVLTLNFRILKMIQTEKNCKPHHLQFADCNGPVFQNCSPHRVNPKHRSWTATEEND